MFTAFTYALSFDNQPTIDEQEAKAKTNTTSPDLGKGNKEDATKEKNTKETNNASSAGHSKHTAREQFRYNMVHAMSLMHALCLQHLRCDWDLDNLCKHDEDKLPAWDSASTAGFTIRFWHYLWPRNRVASRKLFYKASKIQVVGGVTPQESRVLGTVPVRTSTLNARKSVHGQGDLEVLTKEAPRFKRRLANLWTSDTACYMRGATERPYKVMYSTIELIRNRFEQGGLNMPPPILATMWQSLNTSIQSFETCRYLADTPFPFPWAQLIIVVLVVWQALIPLTVIVSYDDRPLGVVMAMAATWVLWALNEVAREIEDPFTQEPNDIPLARLQYQFNQRLLAVAASGGGHGDVGRGGDLGWEHNVSGMSKSHEFDGDGTEDPELPVYKGGLEATSSFGLAEGV